MIRSGRPTWPVLRSPKPAATTWLRASVLGKQLRRRVEVQVDPEELARLGSDDAPTLAPAVGSDPLAESLCLGAGEPRLSGRTFQRGFEAGGRAAMQPPVNAFRRRADLCSHLVDRNAIPELGECRQSLPPVLVSLTRRPFSENSSALRQAVDPGPPCPAGRGRFRYGAREKRRKAAPQILVHIAHPCEEAVEMPPTQGRNGCSQSRLKISEQPSQDQQSAVVRRPWRGDGIAAGRPQFPGDAGEQTLPTLVRAFYPDHGQQHVGKRNRRVPVERPEPGQRSRAGALSFDQ